jgi:hypothetical protein
MLAAVGVAERGRAGEETGNFVEARPRKKRGLVPRHPKVTQRRGIRLTPVSHSSWRALHAPSWGGGTGGEGAGAAGSAPSPRVVNSGGRRVQEKGGEGAKEQAMDF